MCVIVTKCACDGHTMCAKYTKCLWNKLRTVSALFSSQNLIMFLIIHIYI